MELPDTPKKEKQVLRQLLFCFGVLGFRFLRTAFLQSGFEFGSSDKTPKNKKSSPAPLWKPGSFTLKKQAKPCTEIDEFDITKSKKELSIEAQKEVCPILTV